MNAPHDAVANMIAVLTLLLADEPRRAARYISGLDPLDCAMLAAYACRTVCDNLREVAATDPPCQPEYLLRAVALRAAATQ